MGDTTPTIWPPIDVAKEYCVTTDAFQGLPNGDCTDAFIARLHCCVGGQVLKDFIDLGKECNAPGALCSPGGGGCERLIDFKGPYDTLVACEADCP